MSQTTIKMTGPFATIKENELKRKRKSLQLDSEISIEEDKIYEK
jgi:hypothetical protein